MKRYNVSANRYNDLWNVITFQQTVITTGTRVRARAAGGGYTDVGTRAVGKRVRVQRVFSEKKLTGPSQARTRVLVYPPIPGHGYEYRGYRHEYTSTGRTGGF
jgi:hypothetical protein